MPYRIALMFCFMFCSLVAAAEPATRAHLRDDGTLLVDGKPFFPLGIASATLYGENCTLLAEVGFNTVMNGGDTDDAFFDAAREAGLLILAPHYNWATFAGKDKQLDLDAHEEKGFQLAFKYRDQRGRTIDQNLTRWDHRPGVIGWYTAEEPKAAYTEAMAFMYELVKSRSPSHLVVNISAEPVWYHHFNRTCDVLMIDVFPYRPGDRAQPEISTLEFVQQAQRALPDKAIWAMGQGGKMWKNWSSFPPLKLQQIRNQAYLALIGGAKGYFIYSAATVDHFGDLKGEHVQAQWNKFRVVLDELKQLSPILCDGRVSNDVRLSWMLPDGLGVPPLTRVLDFYGDKYLLVANLNSQPAQIRVIGTNYGYPEAFEAEVFTNPKGLRVQGRVAGQTAETVNEAREGRFPVLHIQPNTTGSFKLTRIPATTP